MNILVTGGAGFIGSHLCEHLLLNGHSVSVLDDLNDFYDPADKIANLESIRRVGSFTFQQGNICNRSSVVNAIDEARPDAIVHLAARAGIRPSLKDPLLYEKVNVRGIMMMLEVARRKGIPKFVFASSSSVYGMANQVPFREDDYSLMPISPYAATKIAGEKLCYTYSHLYGISTVALRLFTVYGPRQRPDLAIRKFMGMIDSGEPIPIYGDGFAGRDYTYVADIVRGITSAIEYPCLHEIFNLGNSEPVRLTDMISVIEEAMETQAIRRYLPPQAGDVPITYADISKATRLLGYRPETRFKQGIAKMAEWYHSRKGAAHDLQVAVNA